MQETTPKPKPQDTQTRFAFYGTLRKGQGNYRWSVARDSGAEFVGELVVPGYKMFSLGGYPFVSPSDSQNDTILVELYNLSDRDIIHMIHRMEVGAGYHVVPVEHEGHSYWLYVQEDRRNNTHFPQVDGGDWVKYINKRREKVFED